MNILDIARRDARVIVSNKASGFAIDILLIDQNKVNASITGLHTKHHLGYDSERTTRTNMKNAHISFSEAELKAIAPTYSIRDNTRELTMEGHKCRCKDSTGKLMTYKIREWYPNETLGVVVCILGDYERAGVVFDKTFDFSFG